MILSFNSLSKWETSFNKIVNKLCDILGRSLIPFWPTSFQRSPVSMCIRQKNKTFIINLVYNSFFIYFHFTILVFMFVFQFFCFFFLHFHIVIIGSVIMYIYFFVFIINYNFVIRTYYPKWYGGFYYVCLYNI